MANRKFWPGIPAIALVFGMAVFSCGNGLTGGGKFTLTDIPSQFNGKYAALAGGNIGNTKLAYVGFQSSNGKDKNTLCRISDGRVSIPMWTVDGATEKIKNYSGSDTLIVMVSIYNSETQAKENPDKPVASNLFMSVTFSNGNAAESWKGGFETDALKLPF
jgi:hypothetical protein